MNYYRRFPGDYLQDTMHLSATEDGMYGRLLDFQYLQECAIRDIRHANSICRSQSRTDQRAVKKVMTEFFSKETDGYWNQRAKKEIQRTNEIGEKRALAASQPRQIRDKNATDSRQERDKQTTTSRHEIARKSNRINETLEQMQSNCLATLDSRLQTPDIKQNLKSISSTKTVEADFPIFWEAYPRHRAKQDALNAWTKAGLTGRLGEVLASLAAWKKTEQWQEVEFIPYAATWINKGRWREVPVKEKAAQSSMGLLAEKERLEHELGIN